MSAKVTERWLLIFVIGVCAVPLLIVAFGSFHMRYMADDFCISMRVRFIGADTAITVVAASDWLSFVLGMYASWTGTFSGLAFQGVTPRVEWLSLPIILALGVWIALLYFAARVLFRRVAVAENNSHLLAMIPAVLLPSTFACLVPSLHESIFWYTAAAPYTFSFVLSILYIPLVFSAKKTNVSLTLLGFSFFLAGFAFTFTALQIFSLLFFLILMRHKRTLRHRLSISLLGALVGAGVLLAAPGNAVRASVEENFKPNLIATIISLPEVMSYWLTIRHKTLLIPISVFGVSFLFSYYHSNKFSNKILSASASALFTLGGATAAIVPVAYANLGGYFTPRTWTTSTWAIVCGIAAFGYTCALAFRKQEKPLGYLPRFAQVIVLALSICFLVDALPIVSESVSRQAAYAAAWDERDAYLRSLSGTTETVRARSFHGAFDLEDLTDDPNFWTNVCIARYYNLPAIVSDGQPPFVP